MKRCLFTIVALLILVLGGCVPRITTPPDQPHREVEQPPKVEAVVDEPVVEPVVEDSNSEEFETVKRMLLERGILKEDTPVYRLRETAEVHGVRFTLASFSWFGREVQSRGHWFPHNVPSIAVHLVFFGKSARDDSGNLWRHYVRLVMDDRVRSSLAGSHSATNGGYLVEASFINEIPDPVVYDYILVLIRVMSPLGSYRRPIDGQPENALMEGNVAYIITRQDIDVFRVRGR